jgi:hypothetical protein
MYHLIFGQEFRHFKGPAQNWPSGRFLTAHPFFAVQIPFPAHIESGNVPLFGEGYVLSRDETGRRRSNRTG